jgi:hypothetical protein
MTRFWSKDFAAAHPKAMLEQSGRTVADHREVEPQDRKMLRTVGDPMPRISWLCVCGERHVWPNNALKVAEAVRMPEEK